VSSKRDQFTNLLQKDDSTKTGSEQKSRILDAHLLPPVNKPDTGQNEDKTNSKVNEKSSSLGTKNEDASPEEIHHQSDTDKKTENENERLDVLIGQLKNMSNLNVEDTHTRGTYLIENDLLKELNKLAKGKRKGFKTKVINTGLKIVLQSFRDDNEFHL